MEDRFNQIIILATLLGAFIIVARYLVINNLEGEMREIRFRAWNKVKKEMVADAVNNCKDSFEMILKHPQVYEAMQYTGKNTEDKMKIFEGDIIKKGDLVMVIKYQGYKFAPFTDEHGERNYTHRKSWVIACKGEIIGNKWDNPELLEG